MSTDLAAENNVLRRRLAAAQSPNRQRVLIALLLTVVLLALGTAVILLQTQVIGNQHLIATNQAGSKQRGLEIIRYNKAVLGELNAHTGQISHLEHQVQTLQKEVTAAG